MSNLSRGASHRKPSEAPQLHVRQPKNMIYQIIALTAAVLALSTPTLSNSATISSASTTDKSPAVYITGTIQEGDYEAALSAARDVLKSGNNVDFVLDSPGGDVVEAMKIGELVSKLHSRTIIWGPDYQ